MTSLETTNDNEYIIPFPYGSNVRLGTNNHPETYLSIMSTMAIDAAVLTHHESGAKIIIPGETPFEDLPNTTELMSERARSQGVSDNALVPLHALAGGQRLNNTYLQAASIAENIDPSSSLQTIALAYHMKRVQCAIKAFDINSSFMTVEAIFARHGVETYEKYYPVIAQLRRSELIARLITNGVGMPKGQIPNIIVNKMGARIVDVHEDASGDLRIENDLVVRKRNRLQSTSAATL